MSQSKLFSPFRLRGVDFRNRIGVSPMCTFSADSGLANDSHLVHLGSRAIGGAGLVVVEATAVESRGRISAHDLGLWDDAQVEPLARIVRFLNAAGAAAAVQLAHAGRKASARPPWEGGRALPPDEGGWKTVGPCAEPFREGDPVPAALTREELALIARRFSSAAVRALEAGFDAVEIHAAHGYLLNQFLSPLSNHRDDVYGGTFENRVRFPLEVVAGVRRVWPERLPLFLRISATDWVEGGWTIEDSVELARRARELGVDLVDCSSGGAVPQAEIPVAPLYQVPFAERIRKEAGVATAAVGLITTARQAESVVAEGQADIVLVAREFLRDPYFPLHAAEQLGVNPPVPPRYKRGFERL
jgi:2,4-dienoyl-CoA reductase-like NADH-dependent reductase (Old Yellow Enzyme family)